MPVLVVVVVAVVTVGAALATNRRGVRGKTRDEPNKPATTMGVGLGARGCSLGNCCCCCCCCCWYCCCWQLSRSVFLLFTMISSLRKLILNFRLRSTFSTGSVTFARTFARGLGGCRASEWRGTGWLLVAGHPARLAGLQVPSRLARIITETRAGSGLGGGVPSSNSWNKKWLCTQKVRGSYEHHIVSYSEVYEDISLC